MKLLKAAIAGAFPRPATPVTVDNFVDPNGTLLQNHAPDVGDGWVHDSATSISISTGNRILLPATSAAYYTDYAAPPLVVEGGNAGEGTGQQCGIMVRYKDYDNCWYCYNLSTGRRGYIVERNAGVATTRAGGSFNSYNLNWYMSDDGSTISIGQNRGAAIHSYSSTLHNDSGKVGIYDHNIVSIWVNQFRGKVGSSDPGDLPA